ncbi:MAG TPA: dipeptidase PepE [Candidatus Nanopelagicaceae bacterium]|nr:dipeptidase PepE [Candidatus Nanopelagicaceae bacterium]
MELLLLSNSTNHEQGYLEHALTDVRNFLDGIQQLVFIPFALANHDDYTDVVAKVMEPLGIQVVGLHKVDDQAGTLSSAKAIFVGGGNTFRLLKTLQQRSLIEPLSGAVTSSGSRYLSASAGTNIAGSTIRTTNDMPIVEPLSFDALGLVPFQINPHYLDADPNSTHSGETREKRLNEFLEENDVPVLALREGALLRVSGTHARISGQSLVANSGPALLFARGQSPREVAGDIDWILQSNPKFDLH